jgi:hypothetical protein
MYTSLCRSCQPSSWPHCGVVTLQCWCTLQSVNTQKQKIDSIITGPLFLLVVASGSHNNEKLEHCLPKYDALSVQQTGTIFQWKPLSPPSLFYPDDGDRRFLRNRDIYLLLYPATYPRRAWSLLRDVCILNALHKLQSMYITVAQQNVLRKFDILGEKELLPEHRP